MENRGAPMGNLIAAIPPFLRTSTTGMGIAGFAAGHGGQASQCNTPKTFSTFSSPALSPRRSH